MATEFSTGSAPGIFDSREIIERIEELTGEFIDATDSDPADIMSEDDWSFGLGEDGAAEIAALIALQNDADGYISDWKYGETFIREDEFVDYVKEMLEDTGYISPDMPWWIVIDWQETADNVRVDYTEFQFLGHTYLAR